MLTMIVLLTRVAVLSVVATTLATAASLGARAGWLPELGAVVCETGSVLSHLAILAREYGVPTVVGVHDAVERFPEDTLLVVDGTTGEVLVVEGAQVGGEPR